MGPDENILQIEQHRKVLLRQAEQYRLVQQGRGSKSPRARIWARLLSWLGQRLINLGCHLKRPFGRQARSATGITNLNHCEE